jgi:uncharacterized coiled-coil protein SlyX
MEADMTKKPEFKNPQPAPDPEFVDRVEKFIIAHMAANDGSMPTRPQISKGVKASNTKVCPAARIAMDRILSIQTQLANMPEIPDELRAAHEHALKEIWAKAREFQQAEIVDLKRGQEAKDARHRREQEDLEQLVYSLEERAEQAERRAVHAEEIIAQQHEHITKLSEALAAAEARLEEREAILKILGQSLPKADHEQENSRGASGKGRRTSPGEANKKAEGSSGGKNRPDDLDEPELPMS